MLLVGALLRYRDLTGNAAVFDAGLTTRSELATVCAIGGAVGLVSGLFGVGGPVLSVPLLVIVNLPIRTAVAASQSMSVLVTESASIGYLYRGTVPPDLLALVDPPLWIGAACGWGLAQRVESAVLRRGLAYILGAVGVGLLL